MRHCDKEVSEMYVKRKVIFSIEQSENRGIRNTLHNISVPRQEVAFLEKAREIKGCGSLKRDFYTRFIPIFYELRM